MLRYTLSLLAIKMIMLVLIWPEHNEQSLKPLSSLHLIDGYRVEVVSLGQVGYKQTQTMEVI